MFYQEALRTENGVLLYLERGVVHQSARLLVALGLQLVELHLELLRELLVVELGGRLSVELSSEVLSLVLDLRLVLLGLQGYRISVARMDSNIDLSHDL